MNLIEIYINEVTRRLPEKNREDISMELRSTIEDMLPDEYSDEDIKKVLMTLGDPVRLAYKYEDKKRYIIGPVVYDSYINVLKVAVFCALVIGLLSIWISGIITYDSEMATGAFVLQLFVKSIVTLLSILGQVFFWVTIVFIFLERVVDSKHPVPFRGKQWTPDDLLLVTHSPPKKQISKTEVFFSLFWTALWASVLFNSTKFLGWYEQQGTGLDGLRISVPLFNHDVLMTYAPAIITMVAIEVGFTIYKLVKGKWTTLVVGLNALYHIIFTIILCIMLSNPALFNEAFVELLLSAFDVDPSKYEVTWQSIVWGIAGIMIVFSIMDIVSRFKSSKVSKV
ncbi:hypothetical protein [Bacillus sp. V59.32b]|uniref:HAAS signaling domain-containing protein n=1 Tax=Bacillus sp. V59.32b TaxID=1758642 RepID=UPI000E3E9386|nr:hypothetical protein [Bacillus sp. V59.32b]RFU62208.1 hypothetical protein D0463_13595 [Bacillus sp. V59.32b]